MNLAAALRNLHLFSGKTDLLYGFFSGNRNLLYIYVDRILIRKQKYALRNPDYFQEQIIPKIPDFQVKEISSF
jgi:hypothetical protein